MVFNSISIQFLVAAFAILIGVQTINFGLIAQRFAIIYEFLPPSKRYGRLLASMTLERTLMVAALLTAAGFAGLVWSLVFWASVDFELLRYTHSILRVLIA
jgi:hypothetical protein